MKALLANIDLMVRVVVPDNATEEQIIAAIVDRCQELSSDRSWFGEGTTEIRDDETMPYGSSPNDILPDPRIEFIELAEHLVMLMIESDSDCETAFQAAIEELGMADYDPAKYFDMSIEAVPEYVIRATAHALQVAYDLGEFEKTEGGYYYCGMISDFGGYIDKAMKEQAIQLLTSN